MRDSKMLTVEILRVPMRIGDTQNDTCDFIQAHGLKVVSTVLLSLGASVTFTSCSPNFS